MRLLVVNILVLLFVLVGNTCEGATPEQEAYRARKNEERYRKRLIRTNRAVAKVQDRRNRLVVRRYVGNNINDPMIYSYNLQYLYNGEHLLDAAARRRYR